MVNPPTAVLGVFSPEKREKSPPGGGGRGAVGASGARRGEVVSGLGKGGEVWSCAGLLKTGGPGWEASPNRIPADGLRRLTLLGNL